MKRRLKRWAPTDAKGRIKPLPVVPLRAGHGRPIKKARAKYITKGRIVQRVVQNEDGFWIETKEKP